LASVVRFFPSVKYADSIRAPSGSSHKLTQPLSV